MIRIYHNHTLQTNPWYHENWLAYRSVLFTMHNHFTFQKTYICANQFVHRQIYLIYCLCTSLVCGGSVFVFIWYALLYVHSSFTIISTKTRGLEALFLLSFGCLVTVNVLWFFLTVPWLVYSVWYFLIILTYFLKYILRCLIIIKQVFL